MKCCDINSGQLRTLITIERKATVADGMGGSTLSWTADPVGGVYAKMNARAGREMIEAGRVAPRNYFTAVIRFRDDGNGAPYYSAKDRVAVNGRTYAIDAVVDVEQRGQWIDITMTESAAP